jgi:polar amino acid transport system substrate-binding protein
MSKKISQLAIVVAFILVAAACGDSSEDTTAAGAGSGDLPDLGGRTVTVGVENAYLPFNYIPLGETEGTGWDYEAWEAICELLNCVAEMTPAGWPAVIEEVSQGQLDTAADGISITDERKEIVDYSDAYMVVEQKFIVRLDDDRYATAQALIDDPDARVGTQVGTTNLELAIDLLGGDDRIDAFDQFGLAIQALIAGDVDAVIIDDAAGLGYVGENADEIKTIDDPLQSDPLGFIFPKGSDLIEPVNQALEVLKSNGTMEALGRKYFTDSFQVTYDDIEG